MIPELPESVTDLERLTFYSNILSNLEDQSTIHVNWHTHKGNPSVCWICDIPIVARKIAYIVEKYITKSTLDNVTELSSESDIEPEIDDESFNKDEELGSVEPEYDILSDEEEGL